MKFITFDIPGIVAIEPSKVGDERGFFSEVFRVDRMSAAIGNVGFVQDNHSRSALAGTIRGLHYQKQPRAQGKLIRVTRGAILDVAVDIRTGSPTYGQHIAVKLSEMNWRQLWVPAGFLHGFCTLVDDVEVIYKVTDYYSRDHDAGVRWNDPDLGISWPVAEADTVLSDKDRAAPLLRDIGEAFVFGT